MPAPQAIALLASSSIFLGLALIAVTTRFIFRARSIARFGKDDWLILAALVSATGLCLTNIIGVPIGHLGDLVGPAALDESAIFLKFAFVWQFFYLFAVAFVKLSILHFYDRVFHHPKFVFAKQALIWIIIGWLVAFFWATLFQAIPIECNWTECTPSSDYSAMYIASSATNLLLDCAILIMPLTMLRRLEISRRSRNSLTIIFGLGVFCIVASTARLVYTVRFRAVLFQSGPADFSANTGPEAVNTIMWSGIEACASIICACLPTFSQAITRFPAINRCAFKQTTLQAQSPIRISDARFTGGGREMSRGRRLRLSGLSKIDTKVADLVPSPRSRRLTDGSDAELMITMLPSPLMTPKVKGKPTHRNNHEPEIEMGRIHLRTGSEESIVLGKSEVI